MESGVKSDRIRWIQLGEKKVLFLNFAQLKVEASLALMDSFVDEIKGRPKGSVLLLHDVTEAEYDPSVARKWKELRLAYDDAIKASAIYGLSGLVGVAVRGFTEARRLLGLVTGNDIRIFSDGQVARDWLAQQ